MDGLVAVQENGYWYFDPIRTVFSDIDNLLGILTIQEMTDIEKGISGLQSGPSTFSSGTGSFSSILSGSGGAGG